MKIKIQSNDITQEVELEQHINYTRQEIWIGSRSEDVHNVITIDGADIFQCTIAYNKADGTWTLKNGQTRTLCKRGLKSDRSRACSMCKGCCGYIRTANPDYSLRTPSRPTFLNNVAAPTEGIELKDGDVISFE